MGLVAPTGRAAGGHFVTCHQEKGGPATWRFPKECPPAVWPTQQFPSPGVPTPFFVNFIWSELYEYFVELRCPRQKPQATFIYFNLIKIEFENEMFGSSAAPATFQVLSGYLWLLATLQVERFYCCVNIYGQHWLEWGQTSLCSAWEILAPFSFWQRWVNLW